MGIVVLFGGHDWKIMSCSQLSVLLFIVSQFQLHDKPDVPSCCPKTPNKFDGFGFEWDDYITNSIP